MNSENISFTESEKAGTVIYVAADGKYIGNILIADEIKEDSMKAVEEMKKNGQPLHTHKVPQKLEKLDNSGQIYNKKGQCQEFCVNSTSCQSSYQSNNVCFL